MSTLQHTIASGIRKGMAYLSNYQECIGGFVLPSMRKLFTDTSYFKANSYFPELCKTNGRKSTLRIWLEQMGTFLRHGSFNDFYFLYGFDVKNFRKRSDYIFYPTFHLRRNYLRDVNEDSYKDMAILRDKLLFSCFCSAFCFPSPRVIGTINNGVLHQLHESTGTDVVDFIHQNRISCFAKSLDGQCGIGIYSIEVKDDAFTVNEKEMSKEDLRTIFLTGKYILQEKVQNQHPSINALHPYAINTIRLVTIKAKNGEHVIIPPVLRVGTGTSTVDNWAKGGLSIGIDTTTNTLRKFGFKKPTYGGKLATHPDTGIKFLGYPIPYMQEAINMAIELHKYLPSIQSIGWDIAITTDGPVFIEGNDNWEMSLMEACSRGLRKEFKEYFY